ncbi:polyprenol monophosphomannose synthase [Desulfurococcus mucosus]|uniref:Dolichyl-phosphate beta-D-mannosyltransferase n=1 Tax=Desulfurococcus mucosus (strain ATCC 35584 / DSM 2162 / JCM 9187 / O7/1) TaxID=765177 RepID=E8R842_DESM0|nr:polyprenol monophosphomannose synthase [Desulfurococcus mucosus]ADV64668.1 Dolichyl-phosphate beta-D-mannosyltransferase [Desulfurococcus mucosus DSM 2162]
MPVKASIVVPTYNERENIRILIPMIHRALRDTGVDYEIIVVDDNSPDGTAEEAVHLSSAYPVKVVKRSGKLGLSSAIYEGVRHATGDIVVVMDADLQHPPEYIPALLRRIDGCDLVVASRYAPGGRVEGFPLVRRIVSKGSILLAHLVVPGTRRARDAVSGFFAAKREVVARWRMVEPRGYKVLVEILGELHDIRVCEEPIVFRSREKGSSKLTVRVMLSYIRTLFKLNPVSFTLYVLLILLLIAALVLLA